MGLKNGAGFKGSHKWPWLGRSPLGVTSGCGQSKGQDLEQVPPEPWVSSKDHQVAGLKKEAGLGDPTSSHGFPLKTTRVRRLKGGGA